MKLAFAASALSLFPVALGFVPPSLRTPLQTTSSLQMSFFDNLFSDRSDKQEDERKSLTQRFLGSNTQRRREEIPIDDEKKLHETDKLGVDFVHFPTKEMTGVDTQITRLCATMSQQMYQLATGAAAGGRDSFELNTEGHKVSVIIQDTQGILSPTNPNFGACISGDTMLLCWRGTDSSKPVDLINDLAMSPCSSPLWRKHAKTLKVQGAMASLCCNDISIHEETIIEACKENGIKEIVTTGHSLGGGIGQAAHTTLRALMQDENSPWSELENVNVRSVVFSAPMSTFLTKIKPSKETEAFIDEINDNSCNLVYGNDWIPRAYGYLTFLQDFIDDALPELQKEIPLPRMLKAMVDMQGKMEDFAQSAIGSDLIQATVETVSNYVTPGNIVYYEDAKAEPKVLKDYGAFYKNSEGRTDAFRSVRYKPVEDPVNDMMDWHMAIIQPGVGFDRSALS